MGDLDKEYGAGETFGLFFRSLLHSFTLWLFGSLSLSYPWTA